MLDEFRFKVPRQKRRGSKAMIYITFDTFNSNLQAQKKQDRVKLFARFGVRYSIPTD